MIESIIYQSRPLLNPESNTTQYSSGKKNALDLISLQFCAWLYTTPPIC